MVSEATDSDAPRAVTPSEGRGLWAAAAVEVLRDTAGRFRAVITYGELSSEVLLRTGTTTKVQMRRWIGPVLGLVAAHCAENQEVLLTALCVRRDGTVGDGYAEAVVAMGDPRPSDPEVHAAETRLACYRKYAADLPAGGGTAILTVQEARRRQRAAPPAKPMVCERCSTVLPRSGICFYCE